MSYIAQGHLPRSALLTSPLSMSFSLQTNPLRLTNRFPQSHCIRVTSIACSVATKGTQHGLHVEQPGLARPPVPIDPALQSTWPHRLWVATGCISVAVSLAKSLAGSAASGIWLEPLLASSIGYVLADLGTGVYHWVIDNYGEESTPFIGNQMEAAKGHHKWPWTITRRQFANNSHALARGVAFVVLPLDLACNDPTIHGFISVLAFCVLFSQQCHAWAHETKSKLPKPVVALQDFGVLLSPSNHAAHHRPPYNNGYCIVSGFWNPILDKNKVFEVIEKVLYLKFGIKPRSWSKPSIEWTEETDIATQT